MKKIKRYIKKHKYIIIWIMIFLIYAVVMVNELFASDIPQEFLKDSNEESQIIRQEWESTLGYDVWLPYFELKRLEEEIEKIFKINILGGEGHLVINNGYKEIIYKLEWKF